MSSPILSTIADFLISPAYAAPAPAPAGGGLETFGFLAIMLVVMYFLMIRPQQKKAKEHRQMVDALQAGDEIVTQGGLLGRVAKVGETFITVRLAENVEVKIQRHAVSNLMPKGTLKNDAPAGKSGKNNKKAKSDAKAEPAQQDQSQNASQAQDSDGE